MATTLQLNATQPVAGLGTSTYTALVTSAYEVQVQTTLPAGSGVQIVVNKNGTPVVTVGGVAANPTPTQPSIGAQCRIQATATDVINVVLSSSNAVDSQPNAVKSTIALFQTV